MIKAKELRIGNFVDLNEENTPIGYAYIGDLYQLQKGIKNAYLNVMPIAKPIPLTPEILENAGFVLQAQRQSIYIHKRLKIWLGSGNGCIAYLKHEDKDESYYIAPISHLHQLQNLYFALTGEELTINI